MENSTARIPTEDPADRTVVIPRNTAASPQAEAVRAAAVRAAVEAAAAEARKPAEESGERVSFLSDLGDLLFPNRRTVVEIGRAHV